MLNGLFLQKETKCSVGDSSGPTRFHSRSPMVPSSQQFRFSFYCSTHSPLSLGILALSITFCTCSASFSALKVVKMNKNALILTTLWTSRCRIGRLCRRSIPKYFELSRNNTVAKVLLNLHCNFVAPCHYKSIVAWDITWSKTRISKHFCWTGVANIKTWFYCNTCCTSKRQAHPRKSYNICNFKIMQLASQTS